MKKQFGFPHLSVIRSPPFLGSRMHATFVRRGNFLETFSSKELEIKWMDFGLIRTHKRTYFTLEREGKEPGSYRS